MSTKKQSPAIDIEEASQLSMLAYQVLTRPKPIGIWQGFIDRLKSERAKRIAHVIVGVDSSAGDETVSQASYYQRWAEQTAKTAQEASHRPSRNKLD
jgi:hypothetical protein